MEGSMMLRWRSCAGCFTRANVPVSSAFSTTLGALMKKIFLVFVLAAAAGSFAQRAVARPGRAGAAAGQTAKEKESARWEREAASVTIIRDDWGIAHVHGKTDAGAVF